MNKDAPSPKDIKAQKRAAALKANMQRRKAFTKGIKEQETKEESHGNSKTNQS